MDVKPEHQGMSADEIALLESGELDESGVPKEDDQDRQRAAVVDTPVTREGQEAEEELEAIEAAANAPVSAPAAPAPSPAADAPSAEPAPAPAAEAPAPAPAEESSATAPATAVPRYDVGDPSKIDEKLAALDKKESDAFTQLMDGTIDQEAYQNVLKEVKREERVLVAQQTLHVANLQAEQRAQEQAIEALATSAAKPEGGGIDYKTDVTAQKQFDVALGMIHADPENARLTFEQQLNKAHDAVLAIRGKSRAAALAPAPSAAPAPASRAVDKSQMPPTLSRVPPAADPSIAGNEFAHLESLDGVELEKAFARLTPEQQERYLN